MRLRFPLFLSALLLVLAVPTAQASQSWFVNLNAAQEVPTNASPATGTALLTLNDTQTNLHIHLAFSGLVAPETAAHIHQGAPGTNGAIVFPFTLGTPYDGDWAIPAASVGDLLSGNLYMNVRSTTYPGGEIRGNIIQATSAFPRTWGQIKNLYHDR